jgi:hypothetical protein
MHLFTPSPSKRRLLPPVVLAAAVFGALYGAILYSEGTANGGQPRSTEGLRGATVDFCRSNAASSCPGDLPGLEKDQAPKTPNEAITAFQIQAKALVAGLTAEELRKTLESRLAASDKLEASRMTFSAARAHVIGSLTKRELKQRFLHGSIDDLRRGGDCWQVRSRDHIKANVEGYLEAKTGKLVLFRFLPEG